MPNPWTHRINNQEISLTTKQLLNSPHFTEKEQWVLVYNTALYRQRLQYLKNSFPTNTLHTVAIKACPLVSILKIAVEQGFGLEAASLEEVHLAFAADCQSNNIIFDSPVKTKDELQFALEKGICINADNFDELKKIDNLISIHHQSNIGLRINPEVGEGNIKMTSVAAGASKFGVSISAQKEQIINSFKQYPWLNGLHIHVGSQGCNMQLLTSAAVVIDQLKQEINDNAKNKQIKWIDIGGGLPSDYGFKAQAIDAKNYIQELNQKAPGLFEQPLLTENGRSILANCAWAISRIAYLKPHQENITASIHFGADFMMRPVYAAKDWQHEYLILEANGDQNTAPQVNLSIAGPLCFSGDYLTRNQALPKPSNDNFIVAKDVGAYTLSTWSRHCNRRLPKVLAYSESNLEVLFEGENFEDVVSFWS